MIDFDKSDLNRVIRRDIKTSGFEVEKEIAILIIKGHEF